MRPQSVSESGRTLTDAGFWCRGEDEFVVRRAGAVEAEAADLTRPRLAGSPEGQCTCKAHGGESLLLYLDTGS